MVIDKDGAYHKVQAVEPTVFVATKFDEVHLRFSNKYECNNSFP